jgi:vacuolar-type H+-ATPase subunit E/Vma4
MASASSEPVEPGVEGSRVADLRARLEQSERRRAAAEEWAEFLEAELEARDAELAAKERRLHDIIEQYERQLEAANEPAESPGLFGRLADWLR